MPDLGIASPATVSAWLLDRGAVVSEGDRLVEIVAGAVTVDLPAPANGRLVEICAAENEQVVPGQRLALIEESPRP